MRPVISTSSAADAPAGHALVVPFPEQGHLNSVMQLAKQLASRGFLVTFLITSQFHNRIPSDTPLHRNIRLLPIPDGLPPDFDRCSSNLEPLSRAFLALHAPIQHLMQTRLMQESPPITCIFSDMFAPFTQDLANTFGLPRIAIWQQSAASFTVNMHVPLLISKGHLPVLKEKSSEFITCIPAHPPLASWELPSHFQVQDLSDYLVQFKLKPFLRLKEAHSVLINTFTQLESQTLEALNDELRQEDSRHPPLLATGPFLPPAYINRASEKAVAEPHSSSMQADGSTGMALWAEDTECLKWLDQQTSNSVLYISFGSLVSMQAAQFLELACGLDMACRGNRALRILWVIRPKFLEDAEHEKIGIPASLKEKEKESVVYMTSWAPQVMVLAHAAVGGFLTHCGWNSTLESVSMGVPMLGWPLFAEQWLNRKWVVEEWKIGLKFQEDEQGLVRREEVQRVISALMERSDDSQGMRERALRLKEASAEAWMPHGSSVRNLDTVVQSLIAL